MRNVKLYEMNKHLFILLNESDRGHEQGIRSNQYLIQHDNQGVLLDPGGFNVMPRVLSEMMRHIQPNQIQGIILSHQDPDIVAGIASWLDITQAPVYISQIWQRFIPHYGSIDINRFIGIPDEGMKYHVSPEFELQLIPAHFLHSEGQFNVYDPVSKILFSGDIGTAMTHEEDNVYVDNFNDHIHRIEWFHHRYMCCNKAVRAWVRIISDLDIQMIAPQHGPIYRGKAVQGFIDWFKTLKCGTDLINDEDRYEWRIHT